MKNRTFGPTGFMASEVGLGCWQLGGLCWGDIDESAALEILATAVDSGVNFFDTADVYGLGRSETLIGRFLKDCPEAIFVATKLGRTEPAYPDGYTEALLRQHTEDSLQRLGVEALDLTQLHCIPAEVMHQGEVFEWLRGLQREGKIKQFGASVESVEEAQLCLQVDGLASLQIIFNIFRQKPMALFEEAAQKGVALIIRLPLASGLLAGKLTKDATFPKNDHRTFNRNGELFNVGETFAGLPFEKGVALAGAIKPWVPEGMTMAQLALRWILDHPEVSTIIPGASRPEQAVSNAAVSDMARLPQELHTKLQALYENEVAGHIRGPY